MNLTNVGLVVPQTVNRTHPVKTGLHQKIKHCLERNHWAINGWFTKPRFLPRGTSPRSDRRQLKQALDVKPLLQEATSRQGGD